MSIIFFIYISNLTNHKDCFSEEFLPGGVVKVFLVSVSDNKSDILTEQTELNHFLTQRNNLCVKLGIIYFELSESKNCSTKVNFVERKLHIVSLIRKYIS